MKWLLAAMLLAGMGDGGGAHKEEAFSSLENDYNLSYDKAERLLVFARSKADFKDAHIYVSEKKGGRWSPPAPIAFSDPRYSDSDPWLTPDGRTLYFVSDRPTPARPDKKDLDVWRAYRTKAGWSAPEHLGDAVNGPGPELGPEYHRGILTFASVRKGGQGGLDIYEARALPGGGFAQAAPIAGPFNTAQSESDFTFSPDGRTAAFWRTVDGKGVLHVAMRAGRGWSAVRPLGAAANPGPFNFTPSFSRDGRVLRFASTAEREGQEKGLADIYSVRFADAMR
jgi:Tol biopolymer transport system component